MTAQLVIIAGAMLAGCIALFVRVDTTPEQTSHCAGCRRVITERTRRPCPDCGSMNRHVTATAIETPVVFTDRAD